jgi:hypothetical protein
MYNGGMHSGIKRIYVDSSVVSGMFDKNDHPVKAQPFWDAVDRGKICVVMSDEGNLILTLFFRNKTTIHTQKLCESFNT